MEDELEMIKENHGKLNKKVIELVDFSQETIKNLATTLYMLKEEVEKRKSMREGNMGKVKQEVQK